MNRVLVHGFGSIGQRHLRVISALEPQAELAVLSEHGSHAGAQDRPQRLFSSLDDALAFRPDAVVVTNAAVAHLPSAAVWLRAGAHVLVEKPLAASCDGVDGLAALARRSGRTLQVGYNLRQSPGLQAMRQWCELRRLGRVHSARLEVGQHLYNWRGSRDPLRSVSAQRALGGGALLELSHEIDYLQWLLGPVVWVTAQLLQQGPWNLDVEDTALLTMGMAGEDGCVASLQMDFLRHDTTRRCTLIGDNGSLQWDAIAGQLRWAAPGADAVETVGRDAPGRDATYRAQWQAFAVSCRTGAPPAVSVEDGARVLRVAEAARRSAAAKGRRVAIEPLEAWARSAAPERSSGSAQREG
jgi:predicted dehydrogenase